jgi:hypothetical protein
MELMEYQLEPMVVLAVVVVLPLLDLEKMAVTATLLQLRELL